MPQKKYQPEEIVAKLRQVDLLLSQGRSDQLLAAWDDTPSFAYLS
jgi:hypothetical protein